MSCPECEQPLMWYGMHYGEHSIEYHEGIRRRKLTSLARMIHREIDLRWWAWEIAHRGLVGVMARSGVYRGLWCRSEVPFEFWDETDREGTLKFLRSGASDWAQFRYGVDVNPATWTVRIYDGRTP